MYKLWFAKNHHDSLHKISKVKELMIELRHLYQNDPLIIPPRLTNLAMN